MMSMSMTPCRLLCLSVLSCLASSGLLSAADAEAQARQRLAQFRAIETVMDLVAREFVTPIDRQQLWSGALNGMLESLDEHSFYAPTRESLQHIRDGDGHLTGFGFDWHRDLHSGALRVRRVIPDSPAAQAGMVSGDLILAVNDRSLRNLALPLAARRLAEVGDQATLQLLHADGSEATVTLERRPLEDTGIAGSRLLTRQPGIAVVQIARFIGQTDASVNAQENSPAVTVTGRALRRHLQRLQEEGMQGLILDLRDNGGGSVTAAVEVSDAFLNGTPDQPRIIARQRGRSPARQYDWQAQSHNTLPPWPLVVLINEHTASAAELVAAALKEHQRALLVGSPSQGKDTVQQTFLLDDGAALRLTVARLLTSNGESLGPSGIQPDITLGQTPAQRFAVARRAWLKKYGQAIPDQLQQVSDLPLERARDILHGVLLMAEQP